jgi:type I restriction enzyme S subunit
MKLGCDDLLQAGWKWYKAHECMDIRDGTHDSPKYVTEGYPLVTSKNLVDGKIDFSTCSFISKEDHEAISKRSAVDDGDILYAMIGTIGNPVVIEKNCEFSIKNVALFKFNNENVFNRYIYYFLNSAVASRQFGSVSRGGTQKFVSLSNIRNLQIPLPPLPEQKRIAAILDKADSLRRKNQQAIQLADKFLRAVFLDLFGDPVTNPKGWEVKSLKDQIAHANNGLSRRRKETENEGDIVLRLQDVQYDGIQFEKELNRIKLDDKEVLRYKVDVDDILFIRVNGNPDYVGRSAVFKGHIEPVYHNDHLIRIKTGVAYNSEFLSYCLNFKGSIKIISTQIKTSAGQYTISQDGIERLEFFRPPLDLQYKFISLKKHALKIQNHKIDDGLLFNALSQKAFTGEL